MMPERISVPPQVSVIPMGAFRTRLLAVAVLVAAMLIAGVISRCLSRLSQKEKVSVPSRKIAMMTPDLTALDIL